MGHFWTQEGTLNFDQKRNCPLSNARCTSCMAITSDHYNSINANQPSKTVQNNAITCITNVVWNHFRQKGINCFTFKKFSRISLLDLDLEAFSFHFSFSISFVMLFHFTFHFSFWADGKNKKFPFKSQNYLIFSFCFFILGQRQK